MRNWTYFGDVSILNDGYYVDTSDFDSGSVDVVKVISHDEYDGIHIIQHGDLHIPDDAAALDRCLSVIGAEGLTKENAEDKFGIVGDGYMYTVIDAVLAHGGYFESTFRIVGIEESSPETVMINGNEFDVTERRIAAEDEDAEDALRRYVEEQFVGQLVECEAVEANAPSV